MAPAHATRTRIRILLVRPDHLGDVLLTLPGVAALRASLPGAHICYLARPELAAITRRCPQIDETRTVNFPPLHLPHDPERWSRRAEEEAASLRGQFDMAILTRPDDPWSGALVAAAEVPVRLGYDQPRTRPFLTAARSLPPGGHVTSLAVQICRAAVAMQNSPEPTDGSPPAPEFVTTERDEHEAEAVLSEVAPYTGCRPLVIHPGSGWPLKNWGPRRWGLLAMALKRRYGDGPLVVGGKQEEDLVRAVVQESMGAAQGAAGRLSLGGLAALQRRARLVIATDSGPLHLAALMGTSLVGLFGPADPRQFAPISRPERMRLVRVELPCSPCRTLLDPPCGASIDPACLNGITVEAVLDAVDNLLGAPVGAAWA